MSDSLIKHRRRALAAYGVAQTLLSVLFLALSLVRPSESGGAVFLGQSWPRLAVSALLLAASIASAGLILSLRRPGSEAALIHRLQRELRLPMLGGALVLILGGAALLIPRALNAADAIAGYLDGLQPLAGWLFLSGCALGVATLALAEGGRAGEAVGFALLASVCVLGMLGHVRLWPRSEDRNDDIYFTYLEGDRLLDGENPYARVLLGDMRENEKYATYLPLFYYLSAGTQLLGFSQYSQWLDLWRILFLLAGSWVAVCIFYHSWASRLRLFAVAAALFWLFNRWTLHVAISADIDFLPLALLVTAWALLPGRPRAALVVFGTSLALKHYAVFLAPLMFMRLWRTNGSRRSRWWKDLLLLGSVPLIASLPFLLLNAEAFVKSILFSLSRNPTATGNVDSLDALLGWSGWAARLPMLGLVLLIYAAVWRGRFGPYTSSLLVMATVTFFNSVFFTSYMVWVMPFVPLAAVEAFPRLAAARAGPGEGAVP
jgi:hypothetical protein